MEVNQNFPQAVAHSQLAYQGLNKPNLITEQMISHVQTLVKYGAHVDNPMGILLQACCELLQLETGFGGPLFQIPHQQNHVLQQLGAVNVELIVFSKASMYPWTYTTSYHNEYRIKNLHRFS